jgi:hypothetical protein
MERSWGAAWAFIEVPDYLALATSFGRFLDDHNGAVSAAATVVIAMLTVALVWVTRRQAKLTRDSIDVARQEFAATHRPRIFAQSFLLKRGGGRGGTDSIDLTIINGGEADATILDYVIYPYRKTEEMVFLPGLVRPDPIALPPEAIVHPGEMFTIVADRHGTDLGSFEYEAGTKIFAIGKITYRGGDGIVRITGFCREYFAGEGMWHRVPDSDQEYAY